MKISYCALLLLMLAKTASAMISHSHSKLIVGGDIVQEHFKSTFQEISPLDGATYEFLEQTIDQSLQMDPEPGVYVIYVIDSVKFKTNKESYNDKAEILSKVQDKFGKARFVVNIIITNAEINHIERELIEYFYKNQVSLFLNNVFPVPRTFDAKNPMTEDELFNLKQLKNNFHIWRD